MLYQNSQDATKLKSEAKLLSSETFYEIYVKFVPI